jgi:hypothetical protein
MSGCEKLKSDTLTIYKNNALRLQEIKASTTKTTIDLPKTFDKSSVVIMFEDDLRIVPHEIKSSQIVMNLPTGLVVVTGKDGQEYEGTLESLNGKEAVIHDIETMVPIHIPDFSGIFFSRRFMTRDITLSYLLQNIGWSAHHTLLIDPLEDNAVVFKTMASVYNNTGTLFDLTSLKLGFGNLTSSPPVIEEDNDKNNYSSERKVMASAARMRMPSSEEEKDEKIYESNQVGNDGLEDFEFVDLGSQTLAEHGNFDILSLVDIPIHKVYYFKIANLNTEIEFGYKMIIPPKTHIPSGDVVIYNFDKEEHKLKSYIGKSHIDEKFQNDELDIILSTTNLIRVQCLVKTSVENKKRREVDDNIITDARLKKASHQNIYNDDEKKEIEVIVKKDVPKIKKTNINCTFTNNSSKSDATIIATYPVPKGKIINMTKKYSRIKDGMMEFMLTVPPLSSETLTTQIVEGARGPL